MKSLRRKFKFLSLLLALALPSFSLLGDLNNGLVAWYPFDGNASDMSGNGNHGTVYGATLGTDRHGQVGKAYHFDGVDDWIEVPHHPSIDFNSNESFTISLWLKFGSGNTGYRSIFEKWSGSGAYPYVLRHSDASFIYFNNYDGNSADRLNIVEEDSLQKFRHITVKSNGSEKKMYSDTFLKDTVQLSVGNTSNTSNLFFGKRGGVNPYSFNGWLDDIRIYNRALSAEEVSALYRLESPNHFAEMNSSVDLEMIWVEPGTFTMGQVGVVGPEHNVTLTKGFYLGKYEVTQAQYEAVMTENDEGYNSIPSNFLATQTIRSRE